MFIKGQFSYLTRLTELLRDDEMVSCTVHKTMWEMLHGDKLWGHVYKEVTLLRPGYKK